jgi:hypothetical protein
MFTCNYIPHRFADVDPRGFSLQVGGPIFGVIKGVAVKAQQKHN